jgi:hypothetical protein
MHPNQDQYNFIMNPDTGPQPKGLLPSGFNLGKKQLIILGVVGVILLGIIGTLLYSLANSGPTNKDQLVGVALEQNELIRVSEVAIKEAKGTQARNLAMTTKLSVRSDQSSLVAALRAQGVKLNANQLRGGKKAENDRKLTEATQNNRFDEVYLDLIQKALVTYQRNLNTAYKTTVSPRLKETIKAQYQHASLIIGVDPEV